VLEPLYDNFPVDADASIIKPSYSPVVLCMVLLKPSVLVKSHVLGFSSSFSVGSSLYVLVILFIYELAVATISIYTISPLEPV